ncbi:hypothetical protein FH972_024954 [Carpinus fangiana]|uniref:Probable transporter MCH1 n=1 Tax=Carpinus fangiana TaxID=176857 RepID=A0A5N6L066_9ROSI|nr:hypothetical protein FH972_024954 [Carpinus fangiana]
MPQGNGGARIDKLDFPAPSAHTSLLHQRNDDATSSRASSFTHSRDGLDPRGRFFEDVAEGIQARDRELFKRNLTRYSSFAWAIISCLCAGSITAYSLYAPLFQSRLHYTQYQVNIVSIVAEISLYLPVPLIGLLCDRKGPGPASLLSAFLFGGGYFLAAEVYRRGPPGTSWDGGLDRPVGSHGWPFPVMCLAFVGIGVGTGCMYLGAVSTCAKNFGRGKHKGFALAAPIASFGLGGMWQSQVGSRIIYERGPQGQRGDVDVFRYFVFLGSLLLVVGIIGSLLLRIVDEDALVDEAVDQLERSGLLDDSNGSAFFRGRSAVQRVLAESRDYGTLPPSNLDSDADVDSDTDSLAAVTRPSLHRSHTTQHTTSSSKRAPSAAARRKALLVTFETRRFLADHTMWWLAAGFLLVTGPGEAFINNLGTLLATLYPGPHSLLPPTSPATHVGIVAVTSTAARIASGALSDALAPAPARHTYPLPHRRRASSVSTATSASASLAPPARAARRCTLSRLPLLLGATLVLSVAFALLATGAVQGRAAPLFWLVSALVGTGYGAVFSLVPIIISCVWGVENFATNWGIVAMAPAGGAAVAGIVYAAVYERGTVAVGEGKGGEELKCYGARCYRPTAMGFTVAVWVAMGMWLWAWRGRGGWRSRGIAV